MKVLLDEIVPVSLARRFAAEGWEVEHPILTRQRGLPDRWFFDRVENEEGLLFLTDDEDFASLSARAAS